MQDKLPVGFARIWNGPLVMMCEATQPSLFSCNCAEALYPGGPLQPCGVIDLPCRLDAFHRGSHLLDDGEEF